MYILFAVIGTPLLMIIGSYASTGAIQLVFKLIQYFLHKQSLSTNGTL